MCSDPWCALFTDNLRCLTPSGRSHVIFMLILFLCTTFTVFFTSVNNNGSTIYSNKFTRFQNKSINSINFWSVAHTMQLTPGLSPVSPVINFIVTCWYRRWLSAPTAPTGPDRCVLFCVVSWRSRMVEAVWSYSSFIVLAYK